MVTRVLIQTTVWILALGAMLFISGGDWNWPQAWVFLGESALASLSIGLWLARNDPALLESRLAQPFRRDQMPWDQFFLASACVGFIGWLVLIALDARRFGWTHTPVWAQATGALLVALCMILVWQVFSYNSFAAPQVRIQPERGQQVIDDGPYRIVRHPMYSAALLYFAGVPLLLGSWWGLLAVPFFAAGLGARAVGEEQVLRQELSGYDDYVRMVRYRLVPGLW